MLESELKSQYLWILIVTSINNKSWYVQFWIKGSNYAITDHVDFCIEKNNTSCGCIKVKVNAQWMVA